MRPLGSALLALWPKDPPLFFGFFVEDFIVVDLLFD
jgi:hypothetical protein